MYTYILNDCNLRSIIHSGLGVKVAFFMRSSAKSTNLDLALSGRPDERINIFSYTHACRLQLNISEMMCHHTFQKTHYNQTRISCFILGLLTQNLIETFDKPKRWATPTIWTYQLHPEPMLHCRSHMLGRHLGSRPQGPGCTWDGRGETMLSGNGFSPARPKTDIHEWYSGKSWLDWSSYMFRFWFMDCWCKMNKLKVVWRKGTAGLQHHGSMKCEALEWGLEASQICSS